MSTEPADVATPSGRPMTSGSLRPGGPENQALLTLEPLIDAVREGVSGGAWELSGSQKTTSHEFDGRWAGQSTRSAYLFFHPVADVDHLSIDAFLDETSRGLRANLALVVDGPSMARLGDAANVLARLGELSLAHMPDRLRRPLTLRFGLRDPGQDPTEATSQVRFKLHVPASAIESGSVEVVRAVSTFVEAFDRLLADERLPEILPTVSS